MDMNIVTAAAPTIFQSLAPSAKLLAMTLLGLAGSMPNQAFIEHAVAEQPLVVKYLPAVKPLLPTLIASGLGLVAAHFGVDLGACVAMVASMSVGTHMVNASDKLAADAKAQ